MTAGPQPALGPHGAPGSSAGADPRPRARRLRVAHVISSFGLAGGAETTLSKVAAGLAAHHRPAVFSLTGGFGADPDLAAAGVPVLQLGLRRGRPAPWGLVRLVHRLARFDPDVVQGWMYHGNLAAWAAARCLPGARAVVWNVRHTPGDLAREKPLTARVIRLGAAVSDRVAAVVFNSAVSEGRHRELGYAPATAELIPNGFDFGRFRPDGEARRRLRAEIGLAPDAEAVGLVARYHPIKGHAVFLEAAAVVGSSRPRAAFVLAGSGVGWENGELADRIHDLGLGGRVHLLGERRDVEAVMASLDVACSSSHAEAFPNVVAEAMACGVPAVVTAAGDSAHVVGETGVVVPAGDAAALAAGIGRLLELGGEGRASLGEAARRRIVRHFGLGAMLQRYDRLYRQLLGIEPIGTVGPTYPLEEA